MGQKFANNLHKTVVNWRYVSRTTDFDISINKYETPAKRHARIANQGACVKVDVALREWRWTRNRRQFGLVI